MNSSNISLPLPADFSRDVAQDWGGDVLPETPTVDSLPEPLSRESATSFTATSNSLTKKNIAKVEAASVVAAWGGMVTAGGIAGALGASTGIIAGIAVGVFFGVSLIGYGVSTYLKSKEVTPLDDLSENLDEWVVPDDGKSVPLKEADVSQDSLPIGKNPEASKLPPSRMKTLAPHVQQIANNQTAEFPLSLDAEKIVSQARKVEAGMSTEQKREITENLKSLNQQIRILRSKFAEYAVKVGFAQAFRIIDTEIAKDERRHGPLLYVYGNDHAGVNLRDLILKSEANIDNVQGRTVMPNFTEVKQGVLSDIQLKMSHMIQKRFHELADHDLAAATDRLVLDCERASNISKKQLNKLEKSGFNESSLKINQDSIAKNLGAIYRYNPSTPNPHFNSLVQGAARSLLSARKIDLDAIDDTAEISIEILADKLGKILDFNDNGRTIDELKMQIAKLYSQEVEKIKEKEKKTEIARIQKCIDEELPILKEKHAELQKQLISNYTEFRDSLQVIAFNYALISKLYRVAAEKAQAGEITETDQNARSLSNCITRHQQKLLRLRRILLVLIPAFQENKDKIDKIEHKVSRAKLDLSAYSQKDLDRGTQIQILLNECDRLASKINQFTNNSSGQDLRLKAEEILNGTSEILNETAPTVVQKVTGGVTYGVSAAYNGLTYISSAIWNRVPAMPTLGGWFGGSQTPAATETAEIVNADNEGVIDSVHVQGIPEAEANDSYDSLLNSLDEIRFHEDEDPFVSTSESPSSDAPGPTVSR